MIRLLQIEWMKVKNYRTFWILLAICIISMPAFNYVIYDLSNNSFPKVQGQNIFGSPFAFPYVWQTVSWNSSLLLLIPAVLIITLTTNEFTYKTHRQNVIDGWSRSQFINVKLMEVFLLSVLLTVVVAITSLFFGYLLNPVPSDVNVLRNVIAIWYFFIEMLSYSMIAFVLAMFIKRAGLAMGAFFIYLIIEQFLVALLREKYKIQIVSYLPEEVTDMLILNPYAGRFFSKERLALYQNHVPSYVAVSFIYLFIYVFLSSWRFRKKDL